MKTKSRVKKPKKLSKRRKKKLLSSIYLTVAFVPPPSSSPMATINTNSPTATLVTAYPIAVYWDNDEDTHKVELAAFDQEFHASTDWQTSVNLAKLVQKLLIETYRTNSLELPEVG